MRYDIGDTVRLKSGGPIMTLSYQNDDGSWTATWFLSGEVRHSTFKPEMLIRIPLDQESGRGIGAPALHPPGHVQ